jgi:hypothetical protein
MVELQVSESQDCVSTLAFSLLKGNDILQSGSIMNMQVDTTSRHTTRISRYNLCPAEIDVLSNNPILGVCWSVLGKWGCGAEVWGGDVWLGRSSPDTHSVRSTDMTKTA